MPSALYRSGIQGRIPSDGGADNCFHGRGQREVLKAKEAEMKETAHNLEFEKAARLRDQINAIRKISEIQKVHLQSPWNLDLIGIIVGKRTAWLRFLRFAAEKLWLKILSG